MRSLASQLARHLSPAAHRTDGDLLAGFLAGSDADFGELVRRHGPLVWGVCRRALPDAADAEDAFQAVFLVLVRRAHRLTGGNTIGPWLHRVATWTVRNVRRRNARRFAKQSALPEQIAAPSSDPDLSLDLDAALLALPEKYRSPIVLCHLLGYTRAEAAGQLGCPEGTLSAWLSRGLEKLRVKLRGLDPAKALGVAAVAVPSGLGSAAVRAAAASKVAAVAAGTSTVSLIAEGVIRMFWVKKATAAAAALVAVFAMGVGVGVSGRQVVGVAEGQYKAPAKERVPAGQPDVAAADELLALNAEIEALESFLSKAEAGMKAISEKLASDLTADPKQIQQEKEIFARLQDTAKSAKQDLDALKAKFEKLKQAKPEKEKRKPLTGQADKLAHDLEQAVKLRQAALEGLSAGEKALAEQAERLKLLGKDPKAITEVREKLAGVKEAMAEAKKDLEALRQELAEQKLPARPELKKPETVRPPAPEIDKQLTDLKTLLADIQTQREKLQAEAATRAREMTRLQLQVTRLEDTIAELAKKRAELARPGAESAKPVAFVELTVTGQAGKFEFTLKETDASGKVLGTVRVAEVPMLVKLLTRLKADASAPKELRVVVEPSRDAVTALNACDAAGYKSVKFTGYIPAGGFMGQLNPNQKGGALGYKHYEGKEVSPSQLLKDIAEATTRY
jgi:RNA polymerase sigma factor (sigma-70 family)